MDSDLQKIEGFTRALANHEVPPDDEKQEAIDRVGNTEDASALPVLRRALSAVTDYQRWSESMSESADLAVPGSASILIVRPMASKMESRFRSAIEKCTPEDTP